MKPIRYIAEQLKTISAFSKTAIRAGIYAAIGYYCMAVAFIGLSFVPQYAIRAGIIYRGALECAPASIAAAIVAALLCDLILRKDLEGK